jgi:hypothetical protein
MATDDPGAIAREATDPNGISVVLLDWVWRDKILRDHPEMQPFANAVLGAVAAPDHMASDPVFEHRRRFYLRGAGPTRWLMVVVSYEQEPARVISAFGNRKDPRSWSR